MCESHAWNFIPPIIGYEKSLFQSNNIHTTLLHEHIHSYEISIYSYNIISHMFNRKLREVSGGRKAPPPVIFIAEVALRVLNILMSLASMFTNHFFF